MKYIQVIEEAFSSQKRPSSTSKHELLQIIVYFCGSFLPSWIRIRISIPNTGPDDPDPQTQLNTDPGPGGLPLFNSTDFYWFLLLSIFGLTGCSIPLFPLWIFLWPISYLSVRPSVDTFAILAEEKSASRPPPWTLRPLPSLTMSVLCSFTIF